MMVAGVVIINQLDTLLTNTISSNDCVIWHSETDYQPKHELSSNFSSEPKNYELILYNFILHLKGFTKCILSIRTSGGVYS